MLINIDTINILNHLEGNHPLINSDAVSPNVLLGDANLHNKVTLAPDIIIYKQAIPTHICKYILDKCNGLNKWQKSLTVGEYENTMSPKDSPRQSESVFISDAPALKDIDSYIHKMFVQSLHDYMLNMRRTSAESAGISSDEGYTLLKYTAGGYYSEHIDHSNTGNIPRIVSALIYLNEDFVGGETYFPRQDVMVEPQTGDIVFFPSIYTHPHVAKDIEKGTKYCIVSWWR